MKKYFYDENSNKIKTPSLDRVGERETRFELATATLATWGSTTELLSHAKKPKIITRIIGICKKKCIKSLIFSIIYVGNRKDRYEKNFYPNVHCFQCVLVCTG